MSKLSYVQIQRLFERQMSGDQTFAIQMTETAELVETVVYRL